ncbi:MAG: ABC transporter permease [Myxococcota bacterium]
MVAALHQKLWREIWLMRGQICTISLVIASGIANYVALQGCFRSLEQARSQFYSRHRFADVFVALERAPKSLLRDLEKLPGVARVYDHVVNRVTVPVASFPEPAPGHLVSIPDVGPPPLNAIDLRRGRWPSPHRVDEAVLLESFAKAHGFRLGDTISVVVEGRMVHLRVVGHGISPEYIFPVQGGLTTPEASRFAVLWVPRRVASAYLDLQGAFNAVAFRVETGAEQRVVEEVDRVLDPYGGIGAYTAADQPSNHRLEGEFLQLRAFAMVVPAMFLGVAALLLSIVLSRMVALQRGQIATLKALGYTDRRIGVHYLLMFSSTLVLGSGLGLAVGGWLGDGITGLYLKYFRFPTATFVLESETALKAIGVTAASGAFGAFLGMRRVIRLAPAEAMRPPAPARYRATLLERLGLARRISPVAVMVLREVERRSVRTLLSSLAIAMSVAIVVTGRFSGDAVDHIMKVTLQSSWREDLHVEFETPVRINALNQFKHLPGVRETEPFRSVPVRFRHEHRKWDGVIMAYGQGARLRRPMSTDGRAQAVPRSGALLSEHLASVLGVRRGDTIAVESHEGTRPEFEVRVVDLFDEPFGLVAHLDIDELTRLLEEERRANAVFLKVDSDQLEALMESLRGIPSVLSIMRRQAVIDEFRAQQASMFTTTMIILTVFASCIAFGVVYNNARVALSMREREFATMRVLGFYRSEVSAVLLGELLIQVLLAIPIGLALGVWLCHGIASTVDPDEFRLPVVLTSQTYAFSSLVTVVASVLAAILVRRRLSRLDLIAVLKTTE